MSTEPARFETQGPTWTERAEYGELEAVLSPFGSKRRNRFLHAVHLYGARRAVHLLRENHDSNQIVVDFGCGTGRFVRFFGDIGYRVIGLDVTPEMLVEARRHGIPAGCELHPTDGIHVPREDESVDLIWVCAVLKYTLFVNPLGTLVRQADPAYPQIAAEMIRVLKPGRHVVNLEMYIDVDPDILTEDFERAGFVTRHVHVLQRDDGRPEEVCQARWMPDRLVESAARLCAAGRYWIDDPRHRRGISDYLFVWQKPK